MPKEIYLKPSFEIDFLHDTKHSFDRIIGIDEVGRGSWAGPVAVGAYIYDLNSKFVFGINDSKKLSPKKRDTIYPILSENKYEVKFGEVDMINKYGIGKSIEKLILQVVNQYDDGKTFFLIDGLFRQNFGLHSKKIIKGDSTYYSIAAASILAKVERDRLMTELEKKYTGYGFDRHKGYGTKLHIEAINNLGVSEIHRKNFKPVVSRI